ncbi:S-layer family protein, partial [Salmonella enterica subsp. enterica]|nr:S-layer family protein [Salmonella enterica subsp. enterica serovar Newport]
DSGVVTQAGTLDVSSTAGRGGKVTLEGQNLHLTTGSLINASGQSGGGEVYAGGGWQGKDANITNADAVVMDSGAVIDVSATGSGNGGTAVLWSDKYTNFRGDILARGGAAGGNGGNVETSSHGNLQAFGNVDAGAVSGSAGNWLLDPADVTIVNSAVDLNTTNSTTDGTDIFSPTATGAQIGNLSINNQLNNGTSVTIQTSGATVSGQLGNITVAANISKTAGSDASLTMIADNNITFNYSGNGYGYGVSSTTSALNLNLLAANTSSTGTITFARANTIALNGGDFYAGSANASHTASVVYSNSGDLAAGNITFNTTSVSGAFFRFTAANNLTINGNVSGNAGYNLPIALNASNSVITNGGVDLRNNTGNAQPGDTSDNIYIVGDKGVTINAGASAVTVSADAQVNVSTTSTTKQAAGVAKILSNNGSVSITGGCITLSNVTVTGNNINISGIGKNANSGYNNQAVAILSSRLSALNNIAIAGVSNFSSLSFYNEVIRLSGSAFTAGNLSVTGNAVSTNGVSAGGRALSFAGTNNFTLSGSGNLSGFTNGGYTDTYESSTAVVLSGVLNLNGGDLVIYGNGGNNSYGTKIRSLSDVNILSGCVSVIGVSSGQGSGILFAALSAFKTNISGCGSFSVNGTSGSGFGVESAIQNSILIKSGSNVDVEFSGTSDSGTGIGGEGGVNLNNSGSGTLDLVGSSNTGSGVVLSGGSSISNASLTGSSNASGNGVVLNNGVTISNATIDGVSTSGSGVVLNNIGTLNASDITGSSIDGTGIKVVGTLTNINASITGTTVDGSGVTVTGMVSNATLTGSASGNGSGVTVGGNGSVINGTVSGSSAGGSGVTLNTTGTVNGSSVTGDSVTGSGVTVSGALTDSNASITGNTVDGSGVTVTGAVSNTTLTGNASGNGSGVNVAGNATVNGTDVSGNST